MPKVQTPTPSQQKLLELIAREGVERRKNVTRSPGQITVRWNWVSSQNSVAVHEGSLMTLLRRQWTTYVRGEVLQEVPPDVDNETLALTDWRAPDRFELTDAGRALLTETTQ